jgi:PPP family 3-phenylpropionic acid transporter
LDSTTLRSLGKNRESFGRERVWGSIGFIFAVWGVGYILGILSSRWFFLFYILAILCMVVTLYWLPNQKTEYKPTIYSRISELLVKKEWMVFSASLLLIGLGSSAIEGFLGIYIKEMGGNEGLVGTAAALATLTELPIMFWGEKIVKRHGPWQLLMVAYGVSVFRLIFYSIIPEPGWVLLISLLHSLSFGVYWIATIAFVDQITSEDIKSSAQGMLYAVLYFSRMLSSLVSGYLFDRVGGRYLFLISALFSLMAVLLFWFNRPKGEPLKSIAGGQTPHS